MKALRRVWAMPGLIVGLWVVQVALAALFGRMVVGAVQAAMGPFAVLEDRHLLAYVVSLLAEQPAVAHGVVSALLGSALLGLVLWTVTVGGVLTRLGGGSEFLAACGRWVPAMAVIGLWHMLLRGVFVGLVFLGAGFLPGPVAVPVVAAALALSTCALDVARTQVVLHGARPFHLVTAAQGFLRACQYPLVLLQSAGLTVLQWSVAALSIYVAVAGMDDGSGVQGTRLLALGGLLAGLCRMAVVVTAGAMPLRRDR